MSDPELASLDATAQAQLVHSGQATPLELVDAAIARIDKLNPEVNAVIHPLFDAAREAAAVGGPHDSPFRGVPAVVKDLDGALAGEPLHLGNQLLKQMGHRGDFDSFLFSKLRDAGFILVGKTNTPEFGLVPTTEPLAYGPTRNPWDPAHSPGGSSGGSAAAVAAGMVPVAHASDGGGSIRIPASATGLFGLKPSRARISRGPDISESWSGFSQGHVVTRSVRDSAAILDALEGAMPGDYYTAPPPARPYLDEVGTDPGRLRIGLRTSAPADLAPVDEDCREAAEDAARVLESLGHTVEEASPAALDRGDLVEQYATIYMASAAYDLDHLAELAGRAVTAGDVEAGTWTLAEMGRGVPAAQYVAAQQRLQRLVRDVVVWWEVEGYDLLVTPTMCQPPPALGFLTGSDDPIETSARSIPLVAFTVPFNVTGQPSAAVPLHTTAAGLPIGVMLTAAPWREDVILRVASQLEAARPWIDRHPPIHA